MKGAFKMKLNASFIIFKGFELNILAESIFGHNLRTRFFPHMRNFLNWSFLTIFGNFRQKVIFPKTGLCHTHLDIGP